jgi:hypothetical protein
VSQRPQSSRDHAVGGGPAGPPPRPQSARLSDLGFEPQGPVVWYSPRVMADAGLRYVLSAVFGAYLDKRELQAALPANIITHHADQDELWFDFTADTGDGYKATQSIAWLLAQSELRPDGLAEPLPRGQLLLLGGDEVYPTASVEEYTRRFYGPYRAALPWVDGTAPDLFAIPGNHDWFDGLTSFMRIFCQQKTVGGWETWQNRSYFAIQLPHRWWLWGLDIQFESYVDEPQLRYFDEVPLEPGDRIIISSPSPLWYDVPGDPDEYRNLAYIERKLIRPKGARLLVNLTGDHHHYARYAADDGSQKITAGGGGAFLHPTHDLPPSSTIVVDPDQPEQATTYRLERCYPDQRASKLLALRSPLLPFKNATFIWLAGILHALMLLVSLYSLEVLDDSDASARLLLGELEPVQLLTAVLVNPTAIVLGMAVLAAMYAFAAPPPVSPTFRRWIRLAMAAVHSVLHLAAIVTVIWVAVRLVSWLPDGPWSVVLLFGFVLALGGLSSGVVLGMYLLSANLLPFLRTHGNETFSGLRFTRYKNLLRLHIDPDGVLTIHSLGVDQVCKRWEVDLDTTDPAAPWVRPAGTHPRVRLIEPPVRVDGRTSGPHREASSGTGEPVPASGEPASASGGPGTEQTR